MLTISQEKLPKEVAEWLGWSVRSVLRYLSEKYKDPIKVKARKSDANLSSQHSIPPPDYPKEQESGTSVKEQDNYFRI